MTFSALVFLQQQDEPMWFVRLVSFFQTNALGVFMVLLSVVTGALLVQWILWAFGGGRFKGGSTAGGSNSLRFVFSDALVKIINDFRHLLALIIVGIFAGAVIWALLMSGDTADEMTKSLQAVVSTLGGLVGSIIGYYFGESRASGVSATNDPGDPEPEEQGDPETGDPTPETAAAPGAPDPTAPSGAGRRDIQPAPQPPPPADEEDE